MNLLATVLVGIVALLHLYFLVIEMFLWDKPLGMRIFGHSAQAAAATKILAMNQGLYNGFLAAGLIWGLSLGEEGAALTVFFLGCVLVAGIFGGLTASRKILVVQGLPAAFALAAISVS